MNEAGARAGAIAAPSGSASAVTVHTPSRGAQQLLRRFSVNLPAQAISAAAALVALPLITRRIAPTDFGALTIAQTLINLSWVVSAQWLTSTTVRELPRHMHAGDIDGFRRLLPRGYAITAAVFAGFCGLVAIGATLSGAIRMNFAEIVAAAAGLVLQNLTSTMFLARGHSTMYALTELTARTGGIALGCWFVFQGDGVHGYLIGLAIGSGAVGLLGLPFAIPRRATGSEDPVAIEASLRAWIAYGWPIALSASVMWVFYFVDRYLLAILKSTGDTGVYALGATIGDRGMMVPALALMTIARPLLFTVYEKDGRQALERQMRSYTSIGLMLTIPIFLFLWLTSGELIGFLSTGFYSQYYTPAVDVVPLVALGSLILPLGLVGNIGLAVGRNTRLLLLGSGSAVLANVIANLALIPPLGVRGAAIATAIGATASVLVPLRLSARYATWHFPYETLARAAIAGGLGAGVALAAMQASGSDFWRIVLAAAAGGPVYAVGLLVLTRRLPRRAAAA